jgi:zinc protease
MSGGTLGTSRVAALALAVSLALPLGAQAQVTKADQIVYPSLPEFDVPQPVRVELNNGMVLILVEDHELPLIDAEARIRVGQRLDPADRAGLAELTGEVMRTGGVEGMTGDQIDEFLEGRAASIETAIGIDAGSASMSCLVEDLPAVLELFSRILRHPVFDADKLAVAKNQVNAGIARQNDDPQGILFREFQEVLLGADSPYTRPDTYTSIAAITSEDLAAFHGRYFHPNNLILGLVGDFRADDVIAQVRRVFGDWPAGPPSAPFDGGYKTEPTPGVFYIEKGDVSQSSILMGHLGVRRDNPDYYAIEVFNEVLGGGFASRLFSRVRSQKGLAYAVSGGIGSQWDREGKFQLFTATKTETTGAAIDALLLEARKVVAEEPPTEAEVERAKQSILNSFVFTSDSSRKILGQQLTYEYYGYPLDWLDRYIEGIRDVTLEQVQALGPRYIRPADLTIMVVGPTEGRDRPLEDFGPVTTVDVTIPELAEETLAATLEARQAGAELLAAALAAHGGAEALAAFRSVRQTASAVAQVPGSELRVEIDQLVVYPDRIRQAVTLPQGTMVQVLDGDEAFLETPAGVQPLDGKRRDSLSLGLLRTLPVLLRAAAEGQLDAVWAGTGTVDETPVEYLDVSMAGQTLRLAVEASDHRIVELRYRGTDFGGAPGEVSQVYSDFRQVEGVLLPFAVEATFEGRPYMNSTITGAEVNGEVDAALFSRPQ